MREPASASVLAVGVQLGANSRTDRLAALYRLTDRLYRAQTLDDVYDAALDAIADTLHCDGASIQLFDDERVMRFVAWRGVSDQYRAVVEGYSPWAPGRGEPGAMVVAETDETDQPEAVKAAVRAEGLRGMAFIPIATQRGVIGKFMAYYRRPASLSPGEIELAMTISRQLGFALERARADREQQAVQERLRESEARFRLMADQAPVMIWISDEQGRCVHINRTLRAFWKVDEDSLDAFDWQTTIHPDDAPEVGRLMQVALAEKRPVMLKARFLNAAGQYRVFHTDARPRFSDQGRFLGMIGVNADVTEQEAAADALRESEERFRLAFEAAPAGMLMTDAEDHIVMVNALAEGLLGYERDELLGQPLEQLIPPRLRGRDPVHRDISDGAPAALPMGSGHEMCVLRKDGVEVPVEFGLSSIETAEGLKTLATIVDITSRKQAEADRELLLSELNHRVKNTLAVVQSIAHQTFKGVEAGHALRAFEGRLIALSGAHNLLTQSNWKATLLEQLAKEALQAGGANSGRVSVSGPRVLLAPKESLAVAMALHELLCAAHRVNAEKSVELTRFSPSPLSGFHSALAPHHPQRFCRGSAKRGSLFHPALRSIRKSLIISPVGEIAVCLVVSAPHNARPIRSVTSYNHDRCGLR